MDARNTIYWLTLSAVLGATAASQTAKHPITTAPEGQAPAPCTYSINGGDDGKVTGSSSCAQGVAPAVNSDPDVHETNAQICARETKQQRELDLRCPSGSAATTPPPPAPTAKEKFPFPGQEAAPPAAATSSGDAPAAKKYPYPGESPAPGQAVPPVPGQPPLADAGSSGESSSSSTGESSSGAAHAPSADDVDSDTPVAPVRNAKRKPLALKKDQTPAQRVQEDLSVAGFYTNDGNYAGAYLRARDAVSIDDNDPEAHYALAMAARKLGKLDEARRNFERTLALDPVPKTKKEAQRSLKEMTGS